MCNSFVWVAAVCLLLGLGAFGRKRRPTLVNEETNTDVGVDDRQVPVTTNNQDPLFCLQHNFADSHWKHDTAFQGEAYIFIFSKSTLSVLSASCATCLSHLLQLHNRRCKDTFLSVMIVSAAFVAD